MQTKNTRTRAARQHTDRTAFTGRTSAAELERRFIAECRTILAPVTERYLYFDSLAIFLHEKPTGLPEGRFIVEYVELGIWQWKLRWIDPPTRDEIERIARAYPDHIVGRFDLALDLIPPSERILRVLELFFSRHFTMPWHGKKKPARINGTNYRAQGGRGRNVADYADKPCRVDGQVYCYHAEERFRDARSCGRAKVRTLDDLLAVDMRALFEKYIHLTILSPRKLRNAVGNQASKMILSPRHPPALNWKRTRDRLLDRALRLIGDDDTAISFDNLTEADSQAAVDAYRDAKIDIRGAIVRVKSGVLIEGCTL